MSGKMDISHNLCKEPEAVIVGVKELRQNQSNILLNEQKVCVCVCASAHFFFLHKLRHPQSRHL